MPDDLANHHIYLLEKIKFRFQLERKVEEYMLLKLAFIVNKGTVGQ